MKKIYWYCGSEEYRFSGIGNFSNTYIQRLKKTYDIHDIWYKYSPQSILRILYQFLYIPIISIFNDNLKIYYDEGWLPILFYPIKNIVFIIHDVRDYSLTTRTQTLIQKIYFFVIKRAFSKLNNDKVVKIITVSEFTKSKLVSLGVNELKIDVIYSSFDFNVYKKYNFNLKVLKSEIFSKYKIDNKFINKKIILNVGTEEDRKNIFSILKIINRLKDYIFIKIGNPIIVNNRKIYNEYIIKNNIENVFFLPSQNIDELVKFYNISDVFLFPSLFEGFGRPPIEAQACQLPVISSDKGGLKEVINNTCLILNDPLNENEIINKILELENNLELKEKIITNGLVNIKRFNLENNIIKWEKIINLYT